MEGRSEVSRAGGQRVFMKADRTALRLNSSLRRFEPEQWPIWFEPLRPELRRISEAFLRSRTLQTPHGVFGIDDPAAGWRFEPSIPALFHLVISGDAREKSVDWIAIELSAEQIRTRVLPDLSRTYFQGTDGLDYLVAVISDHEPGDAHREVMYSSDPGFGDPEPTDADGTIDLFGRPQDAPSGSPVRVFRPRRTTRDRTHWGKSPGFLFFAERTRASIGGWP